MGDLRFEAPFTRVKQARDPAGEIRRLTDEEVVAALAASSRASEPLLANVLATEASNRIRRARQVLDAIGEGVAMFDRAGRLTHLNAPGARHLGVARADVVGRPHDAAGWRLTAPDGTPLRPEDQPVARVAASESPVHDVEVAVERPDGSRAVLRFNATPVHDSEGDFIGVAASFVDVTERHLAARRRATDIEVTRALAEAATLEEAAQRVLGAIGRESGWDFGALWALDEDGSALECAGTWTALSAEANALAETTRRTTFAPNVGLPGLAWARREVVLAEDLASHPRFVRRELARSLALRGGVFVPVESGDRVVAVFELLRREALDVAVVAAIESVRGQIGQYVERRRAEEALRRREERLTRHSQALADLARRTPIVRGSLQASLVPFTETAARTLGVARSSVWLYDEARSALECVELFDGREGRHEAGVRLLATQYPAYFAALEEEKVLSAHDAREDPRTREFTEAYLQPTGITSMCDAPLRVGGRVIGVVCQEHVGAPRRWRREDEAFASSLADLVSLAIESQERRRAEATLRLSQEHLRRVVSSAPIILFAIDPDGTFSLGEGRALESLRLTPNSLVGRSVFELYAHLPESLEHVRRALEGESFTSLNDVDGSLFETRWAPVYDETGRFTCTVGIATDVTERTRAERERDATLDALRRSEERLARIVETTADGIVILDPSGRVTYANEAAESLLGVGRGALDGETFRSDAWKVRTLDGAPASGETSAFNRVLRGGATVRDVEYEVTRPDGHRMAVSVNFSAMRGPQGETTAVVASFRDVTTTRRASERRLAESEERFRKIFDEGPLAMAFVTPDSRIADVNPAFVRLLGYERDEIVGRATYELAHPGETEAARGLVAAATTATDQTLKFSRRIIAKSGREVQTEITLTTVRDESGEPRYAIAILQDLTDRRSAEARIRELNEDLRRRLEDLAAANDELEAFSYSASHDLRAPLRAIDYLSQALLEDYRDRLDAEGAAHLGRIRAEAERMSQLVADLLTLSRVTHGELTRERVDVTALARDVARRLAAADPARRVDVRVEPGMVALADARLLGAVLENLVGNAWKFTSRRPDATIEVGTAEAPGGARGAPGRAFFVRDNGVGFDPALAVGLFEPFRRLHPQGEFKGTGIGLTIVRRIVERHGGRAWAEGAVGRGATFWFALGEPPEGSPGRGLTSRRP